MALYNEILAGRFNKALAKHLNMKGEAPAPQLASEIMPVLTHFYGLENRALEGWQRFGIFVTVAALAANFSRVRFRNPLNSHYVAVIEKIFIRNSNAGAMSPALYSSLSIAVDLTTIVALNNTAMCDNRGQFSPQSIISTDQTAIGGAGINFWAGILAASQTSEVILFEDQEIVLPPRSALEYSSFSNNTAVDISIWWRERPLEDSELSL